MQFDEYTHTHIHKLVRLDRITVTAVGTVAHGYSDDGTIGRSGPRNPDHTRCRRGLLGEPRLKVLCTFSMVKVPFPGPSLFMMISSTLLLGYSAFRVLPHTITSNVTRSPKIFSGFQMKLSNRKTKFLESKFDSKSGQVAPNPKGSYGVRIFG